MYRFLLSFSLILITSISFSQPKHDHNLSFEGLAQQWDEAIPLGNGILGALVWQKDNTLRLSLDRADLWDERKAFALEQHNFKWVQEQVHNNTYQQVQQWGDAPYDRSPYPTKLPAAALTFDLSTLGKVVSNELDINTAINKLVFDNGTIFTSFIHAIEPIGYFVIEGENVEKAIPTLVPHQYGIINDDTKATSVVEGQSLTRLGYQQGQLEKHQNKQLIHQTTYDGRYFEVLLEYTEVSPNKLIGLWTITNNEAASLEKKLKPTQLTKFSKSHLDWWKAYWSKSNLTIPDKLLEKQYYLEMYKLGSVARKGAPAITLQAVWTADNGGLPPWKGDFHNDLNTQLSYWPAYTGNRLPEAKTFTDWLWKVRPENLSYTKQYFGVEGLNIPGVLTLNGYPMGGWIQYALSPTVSAWTAQHFYWQWKYSMDSKFLKDQAYTYIIEAATFLKNITEIKANGKRYLPLSASPEYNNNSITAWFKDWTNFDLALAHFLFEAAADVSQTMGDDKSAEEWSAIGDQLPDYAIDETGLLVAVDHPMEHSHRHMSPYMAIYPLGLLDVNNSDDKVIIKNSLRQLEKLGTTAWVGYSFSWIASLHARAKEADKAVDNLQKFASNFCSINSFHVNGDQKGGEFSSFTYRPFTLEGNFAFAQGVHELLLQSKKGYVELLPAIPETWTDLSFENLRVEGGFLISADLNNGHMTNLEIKAEQTGVLKLLYAQPLATQSNKELIKENGFYILKMKKGELLKLKQLKLL